ncbi:hypothetical protein RRG08_049626 [Elysia crispata]|uniref:Uncharacterized protein n=1 Tax=Elysia crispata TaxID=231223 RepID=A0AAE1CQN7_9GAST|nr:hypothetical protein RRG08_049626 [Elysia crispata]
MPGRCHGSCFCFTSVTGSKSVGLALTSLRNLDLQGGQHEASRVDIISTDRHLTRLKHAARETGAATM